MKTLAYLMVLGAGCVGADEDRDIVPPSNPSIGGNMPATVSGRVCVLDDLRDFDTCAPSGAGDLTVTLGNQATMTAADGSFSIPIDQVAGNNPLAFSVTGAGVVPSSSALDAFGALGASRTVPVVRASVFDQMLAANGVVPSAGTGSILARVTSGGTPSAGITATSTPVSAFGPFFDAMTPVNWGIDGTGQRGVIWIPGLAAGAVDLSFADVVGGIETNVAGVAVRNGGITILDTVLQQIR